MSKPLFSQWGGGYRMGGTTYFHVGISRTGKSTHQNLLAFYHAQSGWQVIGIDPVGMDMHHWHDPNRAPKDLPPGVKPAGIKALYYLCRTRDNPRKKAGHEIVIRPNLRKYNATQLMAIGLSESSARYLVQIMRNYGPFQDVQELYRYLGKIPFSRKEAAKLRVPFIPSQTLNPLIRDFENNVLRVGAWTMNPEGVHAEVYLRNGAVKALNYERLLRSGRNVIFSFTNPRVARVEFSFILEAILKLYGHDQIRRKLAIFVEEGHEVFIKDEPLGLDKFFLVGGKHGASTSLSMSTIEGLPRKVCHDNKNWIVGPCDAATIKPFISEEAFRRVVEVSRYYDRYQGRRFFVHIDKERGGAHAIFSTYEPPQEYNRGM